MWLALRSTFKLFESRAYGERLGIEPLGGELFSTSALGVLDACDLTNDILSHCFRKLGWFLDSESRSMIRVSYGSLNVEEFGSVYEGLLEYDPKLTKKGAGFSFNLVRGEGRSASGSYYTPEELTQPLIHHSLDHVIGAKKSQDDAVAGLLSITVCDAACGSGHFLLGAARRIGLELARARTGHEQPAPGDVRRGVRDAIRNCIYGVDVNPYAVELCRVALWLEAHEPGEPLNFLDHRIKCGDAVVGLGRQEDLGRGIANEAFKTRPGDEKTVAAMYRKSNKKERNDTSSKQDVWSFSENVDKDLVILQAFIKRVTIMPETTPEEIEHKKREYMGMLSGPNFSHLKTLADMQTAQFFLPKIEANQGILCTEADYRSYLVGETAMTGSGQVGAAREVAQRKLFFHWFLEFPEVFAEGGFDCMVGNPPFLGGQRLTGTFGNDYADWLKAEYAPARSIDLVGFFFRRYFDLLRPSGHFGLLATNTIAQGGTREGGLQVISEAGGEITFAVRSMPWPGVAAVSVSLVAISKGSFKGHMRLDGRGVKIISTYLDDSEDLGDPFPLVRNADKSFQGSIVLGKGFVLEPEEAEALIRKDEKNRDVILPYLNGEDLNSRPDQSPSRYVINFFDWPIEKAKEYSDCFRIVEEKVRPERARKKKDGTFTVRKPRREKWWQFAERASKLYRAIEPLERVLVVVLHSKILIIATSPCTSVFSHALAVFGLDDNASFTLLNSFAHEHWAWKYSGTIREAGIRYSPSRAFETYPFPSNGGLSHVIFVKLTELGMRYISDRKRIMASLNVGLTKLYNQFHNCGLEGIHGDLTDTQVGEKYGKETLNLWKHLKSPTDAINFNDAVARIKEFRQLHTKLDLAVLEAYGWTDIDLAHDFYEVDYLPENDRIRYTMSPEARKEVLKRLLKLNHRYHDEEVAEGIADEKGKPIKGAKKKSKKTVDDYSMHSELFPPEERGELV
ncbi:MAG: restriction endonuclease [Spirochaetales bacterium]|nr:restriction endonuclease [Spirochaetales bacterium]